MENIMNIEFLNKSDNEGFARMVAAAFVTNLNPTVEELAEIKTAISEAVTNAIIHGYDQMAGMVRMEGRIHGNTVEFVVSDNGCGIENVDLAKEPLYTGRPELERSGMGFAIMESFMDTLEVDSHIGVGTRVKMTKEIGK